MGYLWAIFKISLGSLRYIWDILGILWGYLGDILRISLSERTSGVPPVIFTSVMTSLSLLISLDLLDLLGSLVSLDSLSSLYLQIERPLTFLLSLLSSLSIGDRYFRVRFQNSWNVRSFDQCSTSSDCQSPTRSDLRCCSGPDI